MKTIIVRALALAGAALFAACENPSKAPADAAIQAAEKAVAAVSEEASRYAPEQMKAAREALESAKAKFKSGEFGGALAAAKELPAKVSAAAAAANAKKDELVRAFKAAASSVPKALGEAQAKLDELGKLKKLPKELSADAVAKAKEAQAALAASWKKAEEAFGRGALGDAAAAVKGLPEKAEELLKELGIQK